MGFFDSLKKAKNFLTGGGAKLKIVQLDQPQLRQPFKVEVVISMEDSDIEADKIYLQIKNIEQLKMKIYRTDELGERRQKEERKQNVLYENKYILEQNVTLAALEEYRYVVELNIPPECFPAFQGIDAKYTWSMQAIIEKSGNNPESDRIDFEPAYTLS